MLTTADPRSYMPQLSSVVQSGISVILWAGDADWICNWYGVQRVADAVDHPGQSTFKSKEMVPYTVNGVTKGTYKTVDNFTFLRVFDAGHELPYYRKLLRQSCVLVGARLTEHRTRGCTSGFHANDAEPIHIFNLGHQSSRNY
jgi:hypothetical protein